MSENMPPQSRDVVVSGDENYFYRAAALWKDEIAMKKEIPWSVGQEIVCREKSKGFCFRYQKNIHQNQIMNNYWLY